LRRETMESGAMLLGRKTWEELATAWTAGGDVKGFAGRFETMPTYIVSTTLEHAHPWPNAHILRNLADVARLREGDGGDIVIHGSAGLVRSLMAANLIDEYRLLVFPLVLGTGKRLFGERPFMSSLILTASASFPNGVVALTYSPAEEAIPSLAAPGLERAVAV